MIIQATPYGTKAEEPFAFTYSGDFTDSRVDGIGDVTLNTSGQLVTTGKTVRVTVYILGAGGGGVSSYGTKNPYRAGGGSGGQQTVEVELIPGTYEVIIGTGGAAAEDSSGGPVTGGTGGDTSAFGYTSTGGNGGYADRDYRALGGTGGEPNGTAGSALITGVGVAAGGSPNGGDSAIDGGNGLVRITFS